MPEARYGYLTLLRVAFRRYPQRRHHDHRRLVEIVFGVDAEGKPLEQVAAPLTVVDG